MINNLIIAFVKSSLFASQLKKYFFRQWKKTGPEFAAGKNASAKPKLLWGTVPILNNTYWSRALKSAGYESVTLMREYYPSINKKEDFDLYFEDVINQFYKSVPNVIKIYYTEFFIFDFILKNFDIVHTSCEGVTSIFSKETECSFLKAFGIKTVVLPYGGDIYTYSRVLNVSRRHGMLINYPANARREDEIYENVKAWVKHSDCFVPGCQVDGIGRWDMLPCSILTVDTNRIKPRQNYSNFNGTNGEVKIVHAPNHRGPKGTDYIIQAVENLNKEGLKVKLVLLERVQNDEVIRIMREEVDIAIDEIVGSFYALFSMEAMACGTSAINNLSVEDYTQIFRRYSYLNESPLVSATVENITDVLRVLVKHPELREELGRAGRQFVEKYHSDRSAQFMFEEIYNKIWFNKNTDLMNLFHPLKKESFNNRSPIINHPLKENLLSDKYL